MDLLDEIKTTLQKTRINLIADIAKRRSDSVDGFIDLSFHPDEQIGFRSAWILEHISLSSETLFV